MEKKKIKLEELKIKSNITSLQNNESNTIDGGITPITSAIILSVSFVASVIYLTNRTTLEINSIDNGRCTNQQYGCLDRYRTELCEAIIEG